VARATISRSEAGRAHLWLQIGVAFAALMFIGTNDGAVGVLLPSLQDHYILDKRTVSFLFFAGTCGYLMAAFSSGLLVEWLGRRLFLTLGGAALFIGMVTIASWALAWRSWTPA
jgi:fucose permease